MGQGCARSSPVDTIAVYLELPNNPKLSKYQVFVLNNDTFDVRLNENDQCYYITLGAVKKISKHDLKPPVVKNYSIDAANSAEFRIVSKANNCHAEFIFYYTISYMLKITSVPPTQTFNIDGSEKKNPVSILSLNSKGLCKIKTTYGKWTYYNAFRVNEYLQRLDEVIIEYVNDIKKRIKENPYEQMNPETGKYIDKLNMGSPQIEYKLTICTNC